MGDSKYLIRAVAVRKACRFPDALTKIGGPLGATIEDKVPPFMGPRGVAANDCSTHLFKRIFVKFLNAGLLYSLLFPILACPDRQLTPCLQ